MTTTHCVTQYGYADQIVGAGWGEFHGIAIDAYELTIAAIDDLSQFQFDATTPLTINYNLEGLEPGVFVPPVAPTRTIAAFTLPSLPPEPTLTISPVLTAGEAPEEPALAVVYTPPGGEPGDFDVAAPDTDVDLEDIVLPDEPDYVLPTLPTFYELNLPDVPDIVIPTFDAERPTIDFAAPTLNFGFAASTYDSDLLDAVRARLITQSAGGTGLPAAIEQALFDRARARETKEAAALVQGVAEDFSNRGFAEPSAIMARRMMQVRQANQDKASALSRDILIKAAELEIQQLRDFVAQGIALEQVLINNHLAMEQLTFEAAKFMAQAVLDYFNALIQRANLETQLYQADAAVYRDRIQAALAQAEVYKAQIEGQRAIGQLNESLVRLYAEQFRGIEAMVSIYRASVEAAKARGEINVQRIEAKRGEIQLFAERVKAYDVEWSGYGKRVEAQLGVLRGTEIASNIYSTRVSAWDTKNKVGFEASRAELAGVEMRLRQYIARLDAYGKQIGAETGRMDSESRALAAEGGIYEAAGRIAQFQSAAADRSFELQMTAARIEAELTLQAGRENLNAAIERSRMILEGLKATAQAGSQLMAGASSAVNLSASISASQNASRNCSENFNFSGEIADA